jgi:heme/copper-type cytochrome/quinol oxidase subunit 3
LFWIFILSDMVMFSALFAAYAVLRGNTANGPTGAELFNLRNVFIETMHGLHVTSGLIALVYLVAQVIAKGLRAAVLRRLLCWSLFWHALDIFWVGVFTLVYLMGD